MSGTLATGAHGTEMAEEMGDGVASDLEVLDETELACKGINYLVNNQWPEAEKLFQTYR